MKSCCVIGHREIERVENLIKDLKLVISQLIAEKGVRIFYFGSRSEFNKICYDVITQLKTEYTDIKRIYVRAEYTLTNDVYEKHLQEKYEDSFYYDDDLKTGRLSYIKRNEFIINASDFCLFYFNSNYKPQTNTKSGTAIAYNYALKKSKTIINLYKN